MIYQLTSELIEMIVENTPVAYILLDQNMRIHYINKSFLELRKLDWKKTVGEYCYNISNGGVPCEQCAVKQALISNESDFISRKDVLPDGSTRYIDDYAIPLNNISDDGNKYVLEIMVNRSAEMQNKEKYNKDFESLVSVMSELLESKDAYTDRHSRNVHTIAYHIAKAMKLSEEEIFNISLAARLHDIGKVGISNSIINKPDKLNNEEYTKIKEHVVNSYKMLKDLESFKEIAEMVKQHHEKLDGTGYPDGLKGDELSIGGRIIAVADTFEAMTSDRSYRKALSPEVALAEMKRVSGTQLDARVVDVFEKLNFNYETYEPAKTAKEVSEEHFKTVDRVLTDHEVVADKSDWFKMNLNTIDKNKILNEIFENTPCGYVLMDKDHMLLYASPYFLEYMELSEDDIVGKRCYELGSPDGLICKKCSIVKAKELGRPYKLRREQVIGGVKKYFDMYGIPLETEKHEYMMEVIIDRTEEVRIENLRRKDYRTLFDILTNLIEIKGVDEDDKDMLDRIPKLKQKLKILFNE